jgi:hypothetical protein
LNGKNNVADQAIFKFLDSIGVVHTQAFDILSVHGNTPDNIRFVPPLLYSIIDGSSETEFRGFQRVFVYELKALNSLEDYLRAFLQASAKSITYKGINTVAEECQVVFESAEYENEWIDGFEHTKRYVIELVESTIRTIWNIPTFLPIADEDMYIIKKVKIEASQTSPETFTTNVGKLLYNYGTTSLPSFSLLSHIISISCNSTPYQDAKFNQVGDIAQSGSNISFQIAMSDTGNASSDGFFYTDIKIQLQEIV